MLTLKRLLFIFVGASVCFGVTNASAFTSGQLVEQGCDLSRPAVYYKAAPGKHSDPAQAPSVNAPVPCVKLTGIGSTEPSIVVASDNTLIYAPAFTNEGIGVLRSKDFGVNWETIIPDMPRREKHGRMLPYLYMDPTTDRFFFLTSVGVRGIVSPLQRYLNVSWSADLGKTWGYFKGADEWGNKSADWCKIFAGPPVTSTPKDYPNIVYLSAPSPISTPVPVLSAVQMYTPRKQVIYRSMDGGATWSFISSINIDAKKADCGDPDEWVIYGNGSVGPDGTVYLIHRLCNKLAVSVSKDEGLTWETKVVPDAFVPSFDTTNLLEIVENPNILVTELLTTDPQGNVYVVWVDPDDSLRYAYSGDKGETWSTHVAVAAPDVINVRYAAVAAKSPGTVAISYYGSTDGVEYNGYITETTNGLDDKPSFMSVIANDPDDPLFPWGFEVGYMGIVHGHDLNEVVQVKYAPNGDLWASFVKDMCEGAGTNRCHWDTEAHADSCYQAVIGRMVHNAAPAWETAQTAVYPPPFDCTPGSSEAIGECKVVADSEDICPGIADCTCDNCACEMLECEEDPYCQSVRRCAVDTYCRGMECLLGCSAEVFEAGELMTTMAIRVAYCTVDNDCSRFCLFDRR